MAGQIYGVSDKEESEARCFLRRYSPSGEPTDTKTTLEDCSFHSAAVGARGEVFVTGIRKMAGVTQDGDSIPAWTRDFQPDDPPDTSGLAEVLTVGPEGLLYGASSRVRMESVDGYHPGRKVFVRAYDRSGKEKWRATAENHVESSKGP